MAKPCPCKADRQFRNHQPQDPQESLYKATILKHYREPAFRVSRLDEHAHTFLSSRNCGDKIALGIFLEDSVISQVRFAGEGCSMSVSSADMAAEILEGLSLEDARHVITLVLEFFDHVEAGRDSLSPLPGYGDFDAFETLVKFPTRVACARLAWLSARGALEKHSSMQAPQNDP